MSKSYTLRLFILLLFVVLGFIVILIIKCPQECKYEFNRLKGKKSFSENKFGICILQRGTNVDARNALLDHHCDSMYTSIEKYLKGDEIKEISKNLEIPEINYYYAKINNFNPDCRNDFQDSIMSKIMPTLLIEVRFDKMPDASIHVEYKIRVYDEAICAALKDNYDTLKRFYQTLLSWNSIDEVPEFIIYTPKCLLKFCLALDAIKHNDLTKAISTFKELLSEDGCLVSGINVNIEEDNKNRASLLFQVGKSYSLHFVKVLTTIRDVEPIQDITRDSLKKIIDSAIFYYKESLNLNGNSTKTLYSIGALLYEKIRFYSKYCNSIQTEQDSILCTEYLKKAYLNEERKRYYHIADLLIRVYIGFNKMDSAAMYFCDFKNFRNKYELSNFKKENFIYYTTPDKINCNDSSIILNK